MVARQLKDTWAFLRRVLRPVGVIFLLFCCCCLMFCFLCVRAHEDRLVFRGCWLKPILLDSSRYCPATLPKIPMRYFLVSLLQLFAHSTQPFYIVRSQAWGWRCMYIHISYIRVLCYVLPYTFVLLTYSHYLSWRKDWSMWMVVLKEKKMVACGRSQSPTGQIKWPAEWWRTVSQPYARWLRKPQFSWFRGLLDSWNGRVSWWFECVS